ncbi:MULTISPECIES: hypothetical protein [unclassified Bradyrhizobium]|uniref:hypothetical protein n=1 Tax=unclassified Bradyrhizobium TaxID=2631580 RepID=UPI0028E56733|nr:MULTISPECIES: hypothetical protein [unclassified Bradyrhizobium]
MIKKTHIRGIARTAVSIAAAYIFALQVVLASLVSAQMSAPVLDVAQALCVDTGIPHGSDAPKSPDPHRGFCAICAFAAHASPLPQAEAGVIRRVPAAAHQVLAAALPARDDRLHDPRTSQGPPENT